MLNTLIGLSFMVSLVLLFIWYSSRRHQKTSRITGRYVLYSFGVLAALLFISSAVSSPSTSDSSKETASSSVTSSSSSSSSEKDENNVLQNLSTKELKTYNSGLIDSLSEEQQWASDGKTKYNASLYVDNMKYDSNRGLLVYVTDEFPSLSKNDKTTVAKHAQNMANAQVVILGKNVETESSPSTNVYKGTKKIGRSTMLSNDTEFKWFKS
ncbi:hypothetical protein D8911_11685 [Levilactobacillus brevis]|nr:hypothetical protein D8911_11685 [Levilactobacillus brevis]